MRLRPQVIAPLLVIALSILTLLTLLVTMRATDAFEAPIVRAAIPLRTPWLTDLVLPVTFLTSAIPTAVFCALVSLQRIRSRSPRCWQGWLAAAWPMVAFGLAAVLNIGLRVAIGRHRPSVTMIDNSFLEIQTGYQRFAFPSGHATSGIIGFSALVDLAWDHPRLRLPAVVTAVLMVLGTGFGRVYLGVHWPTDVLGGYALGVLCCGVALSVAGNRRTCRPGRVVR